MKKKNIPKPAEEFEVINFDFYKEEEVEDGLENDEITSVEEGFMLGYLTTI